MLSGERGRQASIGPLIIGLLTVLFAAGCHDGAEPGILLVTSGFSDEILILDALSGEQQSRIPLDPRPGEVDEPHSISASPDGVFWYAALSHGTPTLWKYESRDQRLIGRVTLPQAGAGRIGITPDGTTAFIPDYFRGSPGEASLVSVVDLTSMSVLDTLTVCDAPHDAVVSPSGRRVAVTCSMGDEVVVLDAETFGEVLRLPVGAKNAGPAKPMNLAWSPDEARLYVTLMAQNAVEVFDSDSGASLGWVAVGAGPAQIAVSPDGSLLAIASRGSATVSLVDPSALTERRRISVPAEHPHGITFDSRGEGIYVTYEGTVDTPGGVLALDRSGDLRWQTPGGTFTLGIAFLPGS